MKRTNKFEFNAEIGWEWDYKGVGPYETATKKIHLYKVALPHSCDEWLITKELGKAKAVEEMQQFVKEAKEALQKLKSL